MNFVKKQGAKKYYKPKNKDKYKGEYPIRVMSEWEYQFCSWCDHHKNIIYWSSEPFGVPYINPLTQKDARYYPDFLLKLKNKKEKIETWLIEIKPYKETVQPVKNNKKKKSTILYEQKAWTVNQSKWKAAIKYCKMRSIKFKIITEKELFKK